MASIPVNIALKSDVMAGMSPAAMAMLEEARKAAAAAGLARLEITGANDVGELNHRSHMHGTEFDIKAFNADGTLWSRSQRVAVAKGAALAGGNRFGFYPGGSLHMGLGYAGAPKNAAWGPGGKVSGVALGAFAPEEREFVASLRGGKGVGSVTALAYAPDAGGAPAGLVVPGNIDLTRRPRVKNADGSISTVLSVSFEINGKEVLLPTIGDDGKVLTEVEAIRRYETSGKHLGIFDNAENASAYAVTLHKQQSRMFADNAVLAVTGMAEAAKIGGKLADFVLKGGILRKGTNGELVGELQSFLNSQGVLDAKGGSLAIDRDFGRRTREALKSYQAQRGLKADGVLGKETVRAMIADMIPAAPAPEVAAEVAGAASAEAIIAPATRSVTDLESEWDREDAISGAGRFANQTKDDEGEAYPWDKPATAAPVPRDPDHYIADGSERFGQVVEGKLAAGKSNSERFFANPDKYIALREAQEFAAKESARKELAGVLDDKAKQYAEAVAVNKARRKAARERMAYRDPTRGLGPAPGSNLAELHYSLVESLARQRLAITEPVPVDPFRPAAATSGIWSGVSASAVSAFSRGMADEYRRVSSARQLSND